MEKMPFQADSKLADVMVNPSISPTTGIVSSNWRLGLPMLSGGGVTLRELTIEDAGALCAMVASEDTARFISPPPTSVDGFRRFIEWARRERMSGNYACFAVVPDGTNNPIGLIQVRALEAGFGTAEWGFAIGSAYWGKHIFIEAARLMLQFVFNTMGVHRLEARASVANGRGNGALRKLGAVQEGILRRSFLRHGEYHDQMLWSILADDWRQQTAARITKIH
jgi:ribosomal-protein-serine acetyltransferase